MLDFIGNLCRKSEPSQEPKQGVTQFIDELPAENPALALEELTHWLVDLSNEADIDLQARVTRLARIDKSAQAHEHALRRQYTLASRMNRAVETRIWNASVNFLEATISVHVRCAAKLSHKGEQYNHHLAIVIMRAMRRLDLYAHWLHLRYSPIPETLWGQLYFLIKLAEDRGVLQTPVTLSTSAQLHTTVAQEMLRLLMMSVAAPEHLTKTQIDLAHVLTRNLAGTFCWGQLPPSAAVFRLDFSQPGTPVQHGKKPDNGLQSRRFGSTEAVRALVVGQMQLERGEIPATLGTIDFDKYAQVDLLIVMGHLAQCWSKLDARNDLQLLNKRHTERSQVYDRISVVHSFDLLCASLLQALHPTAELASSTHDAEPESWVVENISEMGYGVSVASQKDDWMQSNAIIGIQHDAAPWQIGVIRRVVSEPKECMQAGIQILSNKPSAVVLTELDVAGAACTEGVFMHREPPYQNQESLLLKAGRYQLHQRYEMGIGEQIRKIRLLERVSTFVDIDQIIFADVKNKA